MTVHAMTEATDKLSDEEVKTMLERLAKHFHEPVMPIGRYCAALNLWASAIRMKVDRLEANRSPTESEFEKYEREAATDFGNAVSRVFLQIHKSNLLARLLYVGESLRTQMCPKHKGRWSGCVWAEKDADNCDCQRTQSGHIDSNVTGWLP